MRKEDIRTAVIRKKRINHCKPKQTVQEHGEKPFLITEMQDITIEIIDLIAQKIEKSFLDLHDACLTVGVSPRIFNKMRNTSKTQGHKIKYAEERINVAEANRTENLIKASLDKENYNAQVAIKLLEKICPRFNPAYKNQLVYEMVEHLKEVRGFMAEDKWVAYLKHMAGKDPSGIVVNLDPILMDYINK